MAPAEYKYVFGPVPSRRLGRSLGVDLVPYKTCSFDCVYCQVGRTTRLTTEREEFVPLEQVVAEVRRRLAEGVEADYVTLSGSGEPTLYARLGELIDAVKASTDVPVAVLTNGSLLWREEVRRELRRADLVVPSLDAGDPETFQRVNRPHPSISFEQLVDGLVRFREEFAGQLWLEVFMLADVTDEDAARRMAAIVGRIQPDRIQLNTVTRPPADEGTRAMPPDKIKSYAAILGGNVEVVSDFDYRGAELAAGADADAVMNLLRRRPCSVEDVSEGLGLRRLEAEKLLAALQDAGRVTAEPQGGQYYYRPAG